MPPKTGAGRGKPRRYGRGKSYHRLVKDSREYLAELRESGSQPFLVPAETYTKVAKALNARRKPMSFGDLMAHIRRLEPAVAGYHVYTCLRFWRRQGLVEKAPHRRYRTVSAFSSKAAKAFRGLKPPPDSG